MEEDLAQASGECLLDESQRKKIIQEAFDQVICKLGAYIDPENEKVKQRFPGLSLDNIQDYQISDSKVRIFLLPSQIVNEDGEVFTFQDLVKETEYTPDNKSGVEGVTGFSTGWVRETSIKPRFVCEEEGEKVTIIDLSDKVILGVMEKLTDEGTPDLIYIQKTIRHELCHALGVADRSAIKYLREAVVEYFAYNTGMETYAPGVPVKLGYGSGFHFVYETAKYLHKQGLPYDILAKAFVANEPKAKQIVDEAITRMFESAGYSVTDFMNALMETNETGIDQAMELFSKTTQKFRDSGTFPRVKAVS